MENAVVMKHAVSGLYTYAEFGLVVSAFLPVMAVSSLVHRGDPTQRIPGRWMRRLGRTAGRLTPLWKFDIEGERREDRVGVWVARPGKPSGPNGEPAEDKIAAIGIRVRRWVSFHGISLNVAPDLAHYAGITPCGIAAPHLGITSLSDLGVTATMAEVDAALRRAFEAIFGATC